MRKFKYAPESIPPLTSEQWKALEKELDKPPTEKQKETFKRAQEVYDAIQKCSNSNDSTSNP